MINHAVWNAPLNSVFNAFSVHQRIPAAYQEFVATRYGEHRSILNEDEAERRARDAADLLTLLESQREYKVRNVTLQAFRRHAFDSLATLDTMTALIWCRARWAAVLHHGHYL